MKRAAALIAAAVMTGCAHKPASVKNPQFQFAAVRRVAVMPFDGDSGSAVTNEMVRRLLAAGLAVSKTAGGVDAVINGTVGDYNPNNKVLIFIGKVKLPVQDESVEVSNPVISVSSPDQKAATFAVNAQTPQMVGAYASVDVTVRMSDPKTGKPVWLGEASYEAVEPAGAVRSAVSILVGALGKIVPAMAAPVNG